MSFNLTGQKVSFTYDRLVQYIDGSFYNGLGVPINIADTSSLNVILVNYIPDASLNATQFFWNTGILDVSVTSGVSQAYVDASFINIRAIYIPDVSLNISYFKWVGGLLEPSIAGETGDVTKEYVDGSIANFATNASVGFAFVYNASLGLVFDQYTNASLGLANNSYATNVSVGLAFASNASLGYVSQLTFVENTSIGYLDASIALKVAKAGDTMTGNLIINTSLGVRGNNNSIDGSLYLGGNLSMGSTQVGYRIAAAGGIYAVGNIYATSNLLASALQVDSIYPISNTGVNLTIQTRATCPSANIVFKSMGNTPYETMRCSSIGNVGIRTPYPIYTLDVSGNIHSTGSITIDSSIILNNQLISGLTTPVSSSDAVNKWYVDSSLNDTWNLISYINTSSYYDGSLNNIRELYVTNVSVGIALVGYISDASLDATQFTWINGYLGVNVSTAGGFSTYEYVDGSLATRDSDISNVRAIYVPDASLNPLYFNWNVSGQLDVSASGTSDVTKAYVDGSLGEFIRSVSLGTTLYWDGDVFDVSAIGDVIKAYVDGSLGSFVRNVSLGTDFYWLNGILYADVSVIAGGVTKTYVDGSLVTRDELMLAYAIAL